MTPRKPRQRQHNHSSQPSHLIQASDYESDTLNYILPTTRTNTELNLAVLRRYNSSIRSILSIAANAVVYFFTPATQAWEKSGVEGTLFVCELEPDVITDTERFCIVVLNRRGLDNVILDLGQTQDVELTAELLIMRFQETGEEDEAEKIMGLWIHADEDDTREVNGTLVQQCWQRALAAKEVHHSDMTEKYDDASFQNDSNAPQQALRRKLSLQNLFGQQDLKQI